MKIMKRITIQLDKSKLLRSQRRFVFSPHRFTAYIGGIGSGKTFAGAIKALLEGLKKPSVGLILAPTYPMIRDVVLDTVFKIFPEKVIRRYLDTKHTLYLVNGTKILFRSTDKPDKLRGLNISWAWLDEASFMHKQIWDIVLGRLRDKKGSRKAWITTTPKGRNWIWEIFVKDVKPNYSYVTATTYDNKYLPRDYIEALEQKYTGEFYEQEILGRFVSFEGLVYKEFDELRHVIDEQPSREKLKEVVAGVDWGYTNPTVILVIGFDSDGKAYILEEFYERNKLIGDIVEKAKEMAQKWKIERFYCDPSEPSFIAEFRKQGLPAVPAENEVMPGVASVKSLLVRDFLFVHRSCRNTINEFLTYCWKENREGEMQDTPVKENDHSMDALRYAVYTHGKQDKHFVFVI